MEEGLKIHVFGSWMWQSLTGDQYVRESSDLDLLIETATPRQAESAVSLLERHVARCSFRIDAELSLPRLGEIHWAEYRSASPQLMVKSFDTACLINREELWG
jgi:phosphoribosyl-dephospho-CoA transferase